MTAPALLMLAALPDSALLPNALPTQAQMSLRGLLPVFVAVFAVLAVFVFWAVFFRKSPNARRRGALLEGDVSSGHSSSSRRRRRRRREHRASNPTRAEAGGLPPSGAGGADPTIL